MCFGIGNVGIQTGEMPTSAESYQGRIWKEDEVIWAPTLASRRCQEVASWKILELRRGEEVGVGGRGASQTDYSSGLMLRMLTYAQSSSHTSCCSPHTPKVRQIPQEHASCTQEVLPGKLGKGLGSPDQGLEEGEVPGWSHRGTECPSHLGEGSWALTCLSGWIQIPRHCRLRCVAE